MLDAPGKHDSYSCANSNAQHGLLQTGLSNPLRYLLHTQNLVDFPGGPIAKTVFLRQGAWVQSMGRELDSAC